MFRVFQNMKIGLDNFAMDIAFATAQKQEKGAPLLKQPRRRSNDSDKDDFVVTPGNNN